jgi:hypothetical protein
MAVHAEDAEILQCIEHHRLMGKGLGYIDMHLLMSAILTRTPRGRWTEGCARSRWNLV